MKTIILIRHGETQKNQGRMPNPNRGLTQKGIAKTLAVAERIKKHTKNYEITICHSNTYRAEQTALIVSKVLNSQNIKVADLRIQGLDNIENEIRHGENLGIRPAETYLNIFNFDQLKVESPKKLYCRWIKIFEKFKTECVIAISHEASLEAFMSQIKPHQIIEKSFDKFFEYSDFATISFENENSKMDK